jgi:mRNA interferase YafQ
MIKHIRRTPAFKRDYKRLKRKHFREELFVSALKCLVERDEKMLVSKFRDHALTGDWKGYRELHISADWLLIYKIEEDTLTLVLTRTGSHDELF